MASGGGGSSGASGGSLAATGGATRSSTTGTAATGSDPSGSVTSGTAPTGANSGATSGAGSGSVSGGTGADTGASTGAEGGASTLTEGGACGLPPTPSGAPNPSCVLATPAPPTVPINAAQSLDEAKAAVLAWELEFLDRELQAHGAPKHLHAASRRASQDEVRHARVTGRLAERFGARVPPVNVRRGEVRALFPIALENAVEGCVRETFGAAVAMLQAERSKDAGVRSAMKRIARDETRHAELSWAVARWIEPQLDADARRRVREAQEQAIATLMRDAAQEPDASLAERLGVPSASQARAVLAELQATLWSEPIAA